MEDHCSTKTKRIQLSTLTTISLPFWLEVNEIKKEVTVDVTAKNHRSILQLVI